MHDSVTIFTLRDVLAGRVLKKMNILTSQNIELLGESLTKSGIDWSKAGYISESRYIESPEIMLKEGDILLSKDGTIGKIGYIDSLETPATVASGIFVIRNIKPELILHHIHILFVKIQGCLKVL